MLYRAWVKFRGSLLVLVMSLSLIGSIGLPAGRSEAGVQPISIELPRFRVSTHSNPDLPNLATTSGELKSLSQDIQKLRGRLFPAQVLQIFSRPLTAQQLLKITRLQGKSESDRLLSSVGIPRSVREGLCGTDKQAGARLLALVGEESRVDSSKLARVWPELRGELQQSVSEATRKELGDSGTFHLLFC